jgi:hypothetical protein
MIVEFVEHGLPPATNWAALEGWIQSTAIPAMERAGYSLVRWCWTEAPDGARLLVAWGEHASPDSLAAVWQRQEMRDARDQFYALCPDAEVRRQVLTVIGA